MKEILLKLWKFFSFSKLTQLNILRVFEDQFLVGVTGIIFNDKKEVLLFKHTYRKTPWSLPGGYIKTKEHPSEALEREIEEESGLVVSVDREVKIRTDRETSRLDICFVGKFIGGEFKKSEEVSEMGFFTFENLPLIRESQLHLIQEAGKEKISTQD